MAKVSTQAPGIVKFGPYVITIMCGPQGISVDICILSQLFKCKCKVALHYVQNYLRCRLTCVIIL